MRRIIVAFLIVAGALAWRGVGPAIAIDLEPRLIARADDRGALQRSGCLATRNNCLLRPASAEIAPGSTEQLCQLASICKMFPTKPVKNLPTFLLKSN